MTAITKRRFARRVAGLIVVTAAAAIGPFTALAEPAGAAQCAYVKASVNNIPLAAGFTCAGVICDGDVQLFGGNGAEYWYCII